MKITFEDMDCTNTIENDEISTTEHVRACFHLLLSTGHDPRNLCQAFSEVSEEIFEAWFAE